MRRLLVTGDNSVRKYRDPRFGGDVSGRLDYDKFYSSYDFLDGYQQDEIDRLAKATKKIHNRSSRACTTSPSVSRTW